MTDPSAPDDARSSVDEIVAELTAAALDHAAELATLDAARAEAWASDLLALAAESDVAETDLVAALTAAGGDEAAIVLAALAGLVDDLAPNSSAPAPWVAAIGTSRCEAAWSLRGGGGVSVVLGFVDALDERHVVSVDLVPGSPETVGEVMVGPGDLLDALAEEDAGIEMDDAVPASAAARCVAALAATTHPRPSAVVNGRVLLQRLATLTPVDLPPPQAVEEVIPEPPRRDPDDDAYALEVLAQAVGETSASSAVGVDEVAALVAPRDLAPFDPATRDAVLILEWADWLGAVIGLVRGGVGTLVDGRTLVDLVNRCPEVTTTIPRADRDRIEWAFDIVTRSWSELGLVDDGRLTAHGRDVLPQALAAAWS